MTGFRRVSFGLAGAVLAISSLSQAAQKVASVEGITEYQLKNGLKVLLFPDQSKPTITVNITYQVGSRNENYGETGMAHLLEHLVFKGTPKHKNIPKELTDHGARPNGTTWFDRTNYFETFQASDDNLKWALDLESDRMVNSFIARKDLDSEMTVVRNEFEMGENNPRSILYKRMMMTGYLWHNYGHPTIGARSDIENVDITRLQGFYRNYYQPDNAVLVVAGNFDEAKTLKLIEDRFGKIPRPKRALPKTYTLDPTQDGERSVVLRRVGDVQYAGASYHVPSGADADAAAIDMLTEVLADTPAGRLYKSLVETKKAVSISGDATLLKEPGMLTFMAEVRQAQSLDAARDAMLATIESFAAGKSAPIAKEELERARASLIKDIELMLNSSERVGMRLSEFIGMGDWRLFFLHRDRIEKVTAEDIQRVAAHYLKPANRTLGLFYPTAKPDRAEIPDPLGYPKTDGVAELVKDYKGKGALVQGEVFDARPEAIEKRVIRFKTDAGMKVALVPKKTRGNMVSAQLGLDFGTEEALLGKALPSRAAGNLLMRGTKKHTRQQIQDEFDRLKARVSVVGGSEGVTASIETVKENFPATLRLVQEILREPSFPEAEFERVKQESLAGIEQMRSEPGAMGSMHLQRHVTPYGKDHPRYVRLPEESIEAIHAMTLDQVKAFHKDFYGASNGQMSVVGAMEPKEVEALVKELFGDWRSPKPYKRIPPKLAEVTAAHEIVQIPDKANAYLFAAYKMPARDDDADYPAMVVGNFLLGGGFLNSRLAVRIRQKEGLSYNVGSQFSADSIDHVGLFGGQAIFAPQNAEKVEAALREELSRVLKDGFNKDELEAAKGGILQSYQVSRAQDGELARKLTGYLYLGRTLAFDADLEAKIRALKPEQVTAAFRKYVDPAKLSVVRAGDFTAKK